jgi:hypothetical protein
MKQRHIQNDSIVGDRNQVSRDIRRQVARIRLGYRQRGQRPSPARLRQLGRALQQVRVDVEHIAG